MRLNSTEYRNKLLGCWMGKNIGGTLGAPFEWRRRLNNVSFYTQDLGGEPLPNDDLDIQLLWVVALEEMGVAINARTLAEYWMLYVTPHWCEYGTAKINMRSGLIPPLCGTYHNEYRHSCGAFIRSEIWACIAPGCPDRAARYAYEDAILDHGNGEGMFAELFCAAMESAAFVCSDIHKLIQIGLSYIPETCGVAQAVRLAIDCYDRKLPWQEARDEMLRQYRGSTHMHLDFCCSEEDRQKGFFDGILGWDVPSNIGMLLIGLLYGEGNFEKTLCIAVNCGEDTDCTAATAGSIFGIMHGIQSIPEKWIQPIGRKIKTACLNLGELGFLGSILPQDVDNLTDRTIRLAHQARMRHHLPLEIESDLPTDLSDLDPDQLLGGKRAEDIYRHSNGPIFSFDFFDIGIDYGEEPTLRANQPKTLRLFIRNRYKVQTNINIRWYLPEGWKITPSSQGTVFVHFAQLSSLKTLSFEIIAEKVEAGINRGVVELTIDGRPSVMLVPLTFLNGEYIPFEEMPR